MHASVVIVGAGPAGASASLSLSKRGIDNILIEKKNNIGFPVQCAEFAGFGINRYFPVNSIAGVVDREISFLDVDTGSKRDRFDTGGYMLNRNVFDARLAESAVREGARLLKNTIAVGVNPSENILTVRNKTAGENIRIRYDFLVIASGPRNNLNLNKFFDSFSENRSFIFAIQVKASVPGKMDSVKCYFRDYIPFGYGWVFPKESYANVGIGIEKPPSSDLLSGSLARFISELKEKGVIASVSKEKTSGMVPVSGLNGICVSNIALCGDAAGLAHPVTGAGIINAVASGSILGDFLAESVNRSVNLLEHYRNELYSVYGRTFTKAVEKRREIYPKMINAKETGVFVKHLWPSFGEYYS